MTFMARNVSALFVACTVWMMTLLSLQISSIATVVAWSTRNLRCFACRNLIALLTRSSLHQPIDA